MSVEVRHDQGLSLGAALATALSEANNGEITVTYTGGSAKIHGPVEIGSDYVAFHVTGGPVHSLMLLPFHSITHIYAGETGEALNSN